MDNCFAENDHAYVGYYTNHKIIESSSGGAASVIAEYYLKLGWTIIGVRYKNDFSGAEYCVIKKDEDLHFMKGSKYFRAEKKINEGGRKIHIFEYVKEMLTGGVGVVFFGLPCEVAALWKYLGDGLILKSRIVFVDLICNGVTLNRVHTDYIKSLESRFRSRVKEFTVRYKMNALEPIHIRAKFENGKIFVLPFYSSDYGYGFSTLKEECCYKCKFKGFDRKSDITIGDHLGVDHSFSGWNKMGMSLIITHSSKGEKIIEAVSGNTFKLISVDIQDSIIHNPMYYLSVEKKVKDTMIRYFYKNGLHSYCVTSMGGLKYYYVRLKGRLKFYLNSIRGIQSENI